MKLWLIIIILVSKDKIKIRRNKVISGILIPRVVN